MAEQVFVALGSNIRPEMHLAAAVLRLAEYLRIEALSRLYRTEPIGPAGQAPFLNAALLVTTALPAVELKYQVLRPIEVQLGRVRTADKYAPRTIDLDIALYGSRVLDKEAAGLLIPDPATLQHPHVALPLADLAPDFVHPLCGCTLDEIARRLVPRAGVSVAGAALAIECGWPGLADRLGAVAPGRSAAASRL